MLEAVLFVSIISKVRIHVQEELVLADGIARRILVVQLRDALVFVLDHLTQDLQEAPAFVALTHDLFTLVLDLDQIPRMVSVMDEVCCDFFFNISVFSDRLELGVDAGQELVPEVDAIDEAGDVGGGTITETPEVGFEQLHVVQLQLVKLYPLLVGVLAQEELVDERSDGFDM